MSIPFGGLRGPKNSGSQQPRPPQPRPKARPPQNINSGQPPRGGSGALPPPPDVDEIHSTGSGGDKTFVPRPAPIPEAPPNRRMGEPPKLKPPRRIVEGKAASSPGPHKFGRPTEKGWDRDGPESPSSVRRLMWWAVRAIAAGGLWALIEWWLA